MRKLKHMGGHFGDALKALRESRGMKLREICMIADLDPGNYSRMENGIFLPPKTLDELNNITKALKASTEEKQQLLTAIREEMLWRIKRTAQVEIDRLNREFS